MHYSYLLPSLLKRRVLCLGILLFLFSPIIAYSKELNKQYGYSVFNDLKYREDFKNFDYVNPDAPKGGNIKFAHIGTFDSLNLFILKGEKAPGLDYTFDSLLVSSIDEPNSTYGLLAESLEFPETREYVIFNLRKNAYFHDHSPITAEDLKFTFEILREKGDPNYKLILQDIAKAEVLSPTRIKYTIKNPANKQAIYLIGSLPVLSRAFFKDKEFDRYDRHPMMASGPYKIKAFEFGKHITYERVKDYWAQDLPVRKGQYNFDNIYYINFLDEVIAVEALKAGEYDYRDENVSRVWANAYNTDAVKAGRMKKETIVHHIPATRQFYAMNMRRPDFQDPKFRQALTLAFDFEWINKYLFYGIYKRLESYFDNSEFKSSGIPEGDELKLLEKFRGRVPEPLFTTPFKLPSNSNNLQKRENLSKAKRLLLSAGYKIVDGKMISPHTGKPLVLTVLIQSDSFIRILNFYRNDLKDIGITMDIHRVDAAQYQKRMDNFDFDMTTIAFPGSSAPGPEQMQLWHSKADTKGGYNISGIHNPVVDELVEKLIVAPNKQELITVTKALDRVLLWNYYNVLQYYSNAFRIVYWDKFEMPKIKPSFAVGVDTWWSKK